MWYLNYDQIEIIYMDICKKKKRSVFMMCVSPWWLFFKVNRSNLSVESVCFSMLKWSELMNHCRIPCWDISRKRLCFSFFMYMCPGVAMCIIQAILVVLFYYFCIILNAMFGLFFFSFETCALLCDFGLTTIQ